MPTAAGRTITGVCLAHVSALFFGPRIQAPLRTRSSTSIGSTMSTSSFRLTRHAGSGGDVSILADALEGKGRGEGGATSSSTRASKASTKAAGKEAQQQPVSIDVPQRRFSADDAERVMQDPVEGEGEIFQRASSSASDQDARPAQRVLDSKPAQARENAVT